MGMLKKKINHLPKILWKTERLLKTYSVTTRWGEKEQVNAVDAVDLTIYTGETLGIVGESGCGKTTLGKLLIRILEPTGGKIFFGDCDISRISERRLRTLRKNFQIIFQNPYKALNPRISAGYAVSEGLSDNVSSGEKVKRARALLETVGISGKRFDNFPHQFSGGERQRISIARALSTSPRFLVCDEPTSNLDISIQTQILNLFADLKEKFSLTYLFISHDLKVVELVSNRIAVMYSGKIVEIGLAEEVMLKPVHPYSKLLVNSAFFKKQKEPVRSRQVSGGCAYSARCPYRKKVCIENVPLLKTIGKQHSVACHLFGKSSVNSVFPPH